jgi:hypothetical protein
LVWQSAKKCKELGVCGSNFAAVSIVREGPLAALKRPACQMTVLDRLRATHTAYRPLILSTAHENENAFGFGGGPLYRTRSRECLWVRTGSVSSRRRIVPLSPPAWPELWIIKRPTRDGDNRYRCYIVSGVRMTVNVAKRSSSALASRAGTELLSIGRAPRIRHWKSMSEMKEAGATRRSPFLGGEIVGRINELAAISELPEHPSRIS